MPLYEYECASCGETTEAIQSFSEPPLTVCPHCGGVLVKLLSSPAVQFKGAGWYVTDYGKSGGKERQGRKTDESPGDSSKGQEGAGAGKGASSEGAAGETGKTGDSSSGKKEGGDRGSRAASGPPGAPPSPAPSKKKNGGSK